MNRILTRVTQIPGMRTIWRRFPIGSLRLRVEYDVSPRPNYAYGVYSAAELAKCLGVPGISVIEFGVAGGRGLLALEAIAEEVSKVLGVQIAVFGFDTGTGMPPPLDYRDLPHVWAQGDYAMNQASLKQKLKRATLLLGEVKLTIPSFLSTPDLPPIGFVSFDLDYYSSTRDAFQLFNGGYETRLPRVLCYFDDMVWPTFAYHNPHVGELGAIRAYNSEHEEKIEPVYMLRDTRPHPAPWNEQTYVMHDFRHPLYCVNIMPRGERYTEMPL